MQTDNTTTYDKCMCLEVIRAMSRVCPRRKISNV